jgi:thioredoxin reductase (NADPH)
LEGLTVRNVKDGSTSHLEVEGFFISIGMDPASDFIRGLVELSEWGQVKVNSRMATSRPGIYAAGDVCDACPKQVATAVGTGVRAALAVDEYLSSL